MPKEKKKTTAAPSPMHISKKKLDTESDTMSDVEDDSSSRVGPSGATLKPEGEYIVKFTVELELKSLAGAQIFKGALYDPNLLPDHRGDFFKHQSAMLCQND